MAKNPSVTKWGPELAAAREATGITKDLVADAVVFSLIAVESGGKPEAWSTRETSKGKKYKTQFVGILQQGTAVSKDLKKTTRKPGRHFLGTPVSPGDPNYSKGKKYPLAHYLIGKGQLGIEEFLRLQEKYSKTSKWNPEVMAIVWKGGVGTASRYNKKVRLGGGQAGIDYLAAGSPYTKKSGKTGKIPGTLEYLRRFQKQMKIYDGEELLNTGDIQENKTHGTTANVDTISGIRRQTFKANPFELPTYITPEELRKGIIAEVFYLNDWHLAQVIDPENKKVEGDKEEPDISDDAIEAQAELVNQQDSSETVKNKGGRGDTSSDRRNRYASSIVESEFYARRFAARSVPAITGPFNPYPIAGFPGLVLSPGRPVLGYITNVTHQINVAGGSGTTGVSMVSPRYWDEGEVWYWLGGEEKSEDPNTEALYRRFPQWHNRKVVATNSFATDPTKVSTASTTQEIDQYYLFMLGTNAIEYYSNNSGKVSDPNTVVKSIEDRDPSDLDVNPETLEILEYNKLIAETDENGWFKQGTLCHRFYGPVKPYEAHEAHGTIEDQIDYTERYGIREYELFVEFLGNKFIKDPSTERVCLVGNTFGDKLNSLQRQVLNYIEDLSHRSLDGGV